MFATMKSALKNQRGQGMVEYSLIIALIAVALIGGLQTMEGGITGAFNKITTALNAL